MEVRGARGFTFIELLVVVLILSTLMAAALPLYVNAVGDSEKKTCRANLRTIANAVQAARVREVAPNYAHEIARNREVIDVGTRTGCLSDLFAVPVCPAGGIYTVARGSSGTPETYQVQCSLPAHGTFEPGVDSH